jgi:Glycosyltransferase family 87
MTKARRDGLYLMLIGCAVFLFLGIALERLSPASMIDFKVHYFGARCLLEHCDPYKQSDVLRIYDAEGGHGPAETLGSRLSATRFVYQPTIFLFTAPLAMLKFGPAEELWMLLTLSSVILASFLLWSLAGEDAPLISALLIAFMLANSELLVITGNPSGIAIGLCIIAVWCLVKERCVPAGALCLAVSLLVKPHAVGFIWLYFLLSGGVYRKRAIQTLALVVLLGLPTVLWVTHLSPHWIPELRATLSSVSAHGGPDDPGPASSGGHGISMMINLQTILSLIRDDPRFYNPATYFLCGVLLLAWSLKTLRLRATPTNAWLALASVAPLSLLPVYHRQGDALLLLLSVPACTMLWAEVGRIARSALLVTAAGFAFTGDITWAIILGIINNLHLTMTRQAWQILTVIQILPAPLILLVMAIFYLWAKMRYEQIPVFAQKHEIVNAAPAVQIKA